MRITRTSRRVQVQPGGKAIAPRVDDPRGFALENASGRSLTVSFRYDEEQHVQTIVVEEPRPTRQIPGEAQSHGTGELPA
jgi:hypothetical protein